MVAIPIPSSVFPGGTSWLISRYALDHCLAGIPIPLFNFNVWTLEPLEFLDIWWNPFFLPLTQYLLWPQLQQNPKAQWIHLHASLLARCSLQRLHFTFFFFLQTYLLWWWPKSSNFGFVSPKHIVPKGFRLLNVFFCVLQTLNFVLRLFFLANLPCRSLLFKVRCIVVL